MTKFTEELLTKYQALADKELLHHSNPKIKAFFKRISDEGAPVFQESYAGQMSFFMAPFSKKLKGVDSVCVGVPMDASAPMRAGGGATCSTSGTGMV